jgi:MFS family permease
MTENNESTKNALKFAGIEVPPELTKGNFFFLFFNTFLAGLLMSVLGILQPAFLKDIIKVSPDFFGSINGLLMNINEIATLTLVAFVGALSDKTGRKILAFLGFVVLAIFYYLLGMSNEIASFLLVPSGISSQICALLSFVPSESAKFTEFAPGLLITYILRLGIGIGIVLVFPQFIAMAADYTYEKDRGKGMAFNGLMMGVSALVVFGALAPVLQSKGVGSLFYITSAIALAGAVCTWIFLKERLPEKKEGKKGLKEIFEVVNKSLALKTSYVCTLITRADIIVIATFLMSWAVKIGDNYGLTSEAATQKAAFPMMAFSFASFFSFPVIGILLDKWGRVPTLILSLACGGVGMVLLSICPDPFSGLVYGAVILISFGIAGSITGANTLASDASPPGMVGTVLGGLNTMQPIGIMFFVGIGGYLFDTIGPGWAFAVKGVANLFLGIWIFLIKDRVSQSLLQKS